MQPRILLVDDYEDSREVYAQYLRLSGFDVLEAADGLDGLAEATVQLPDAIVLDISLPRLGGLEISRRLKANPLTAAIPIICLSGDSRAGYEQRVADAGCALALSKPCPPDDLIQAIRRLLPSASQSA